MEKLYQIICKSMKKNEKDSKVEKIGNVQISNEVITQIASVAASDIEGVIEVANPFPRSLYSVVNKKGTAKGISVSFNEDKSMNIDLWVALKYGYVIPTVSKKIQVAVESAVKAMTGMSISCVNIHVYSVIF